MQVKMIIFYLQERQIELIQVLENNEDKLDIHYLITMSSEMLISLYKLLLNQTFLKAAKKPQTFLYLKKT